MKRSTPWTLAALVGCGTSASYVYAPQDAKSWSDGYLTTGIAVPPEAPQGKVELSSFGIVELTPDSGEPISTLHVRFAITNEGDAKPWTVEMTEQLVEISGEGRSAPIYVNTDVTTLPSIAIARRDRRVLDLYYALPTSIRDEEDLPSFEFLWQVTTPARMYASRTHFERLEQEPPPTQPAVVLYSGWGPYWWYDPLYLHAAFIHYQPIVIPRPGHVVVTRQPTRHYRGVHRR